MLFAVIPTLGERNDTLFPLLQRLHDDGVTPIVLDNGPEDVDFSGLDFVIYDQRHDWDTDPVNLSWLWNQGLEWAEELAGGEEFVVAVLNDDLVIPAGMVHMLANAIMHEDAAASFACPFGRTGKLDASSPLTLGNRMIGYAFALRGSKGLRADERFLWWWGDTDLDVRARKAGGTVGIVIPGLEHKDPNGYTNRRPELAEQAGRDRQTFADIHGFIPW